MLSAAPWEPDKGPFSEDTTDSVLNVVPIANGYGPFPDLSTASSALAAQCYGGCYYRASDGSYGAVLGTATRLYKLNTGVSPYGFTDISGASAPYAVPTGQMWQFERFKTKLYACSLGAPLQEYDVDAGGVFADTAGSPPRSKYIKTIGDFLVLGYLKVGGTESPAKWTTSGLADATTWTVGAKLADEQDIAGSDEIMGLLGGDKGGRVFLRRAKRDLILSGDVDMAIKSEVIDPAYGVVAPLSIVAIGGNDYAYLAEDGFQRGDAKTPIGAERVNRYFFADVDLSKLEEVQGVADPYNHMCWWRYQDNNGAYKMIGWDWELDKWVRSDAAAQVLLNIVTPGVTLEALDAIFLALYGAASVDVAGAESFDSRRWKGGRPIFAAVLADFTLGLFTGSAKAAQIDTTARTISGDVFRRSGITGGYIVSDTNSGTLALAVGDKHGDVNTMAFGTAKALSTRTGIAPLRGDGRIARVRVAIPAATAWHYVHGVELQSKNTGKG